MPNEKIVIEQFQHPAQHQVPMTRDEQKAAGLIAQTSVSIHPRNNGKQKAIRS